MECNELPVTGPTHVWLTDGGPPVPDILTTRFLGRQASRGGSGACFHAAPLAANLLGNTGEWARVGRGPRM